MTYLTLPTYIYDEMTLEEKQKIILDDITKPIVIRGMYQPKAKDMSIDEIADIFGDSIFEAETYKTNQSKTVDKHYTPVSFPDLLNYWKFDYEPIYYIADCNIFVLQNCNRRNDLINILSSPATANLRTTHELLLYVGKDHRSDLHLHCYSDFILNQLYGSKTVYIFDNYDNQNISKRSFFKEEVSNFAKQNFFDLDHRNMKIYKTILHPGDSLLIPPWSWHATQGHGLNFSVTQVFDRSSALYLLKNPNLICETLSFNYLYFKKEIKRYITVMIVILTLTLTLMFTYRIYRK